MPARLRPRDLALRLSVADIFKTHALGSCVAGRIEGGSLIAGSPLVCRPGNLPGQVMLCAFVWRGAGARGEVYAVRLAELIKRNVNVFKTWNADPE